MTNTISTSHHSGLSRIWSSAWLHTRSPQIILWSSDVCLKLWPCLTVGDTTCVSRMPTGSELLKWSTWDQSWEISLFQETSVAVKGNRSKVFWAAGSGPISEKARETLPAKCYRLNMVHPGLWWSQLILSIVVSVLKTMLLDAAHRTEFIRWAGHKPNAGPWISRVLSTLFHHWVG